MLSCRPNGPDRSPACSCTTIPPTKNTQAKIIEGLFEEKERGYSLVLRAVQEGVVSVDLALTAGMSLLHLAAERATAELVSSLLARGADVNKADAWGAQPIHYALSADEHGLGKARKEACALLLINAPGCQVNGVSKRRGEVTPLMLACQGGYERAVVALLAKGANVRARDDHGMPVLYYAASSMAEVAEAIAVLLLAQHGAPFDTPQEGERVLNVAARTGKFLLVRAILSRTRAGWGMAAAGLHVQMGEAAKFAVAFKGNLMVLHVLEEFGWDVQKEGVSPPSWCSPIPLLREACRTGDVEMATYLLDKGCDPMAYDE